MQWDTSEHDWLEGRGPGRYLVRMIDDATSWSWGRFVKSDSTPHNTGVLWEYLEKNGRMVDVYTDRDSMFAVPPRAGESQQQQRQADRLTQLGRALRELGIGSILANSPQAKGRIERSFLTAQNRLVKQLRLAKVSTLETANVFLEKEYWPEWNAQFARPVADFPNQHRALTPQLDLAAILRRSVSSPTITRFPLPGATTKSRAKMCRPASGANVCVSNCAWRRVTGALSRPLSPHRPVRCAHAGTRTRRPQTTAQGSQRRWQKLLDAGIFRPSGPAVVEVAGLKPIRKTLVSEGPKPRLGSFTRSMCRPGRPSSATG